MLPKTHRLTTKECDTVLKEGRKIASPFFFARMRPNSLSHTRYAIVVSKKFAKTAILRNTIRRRAYTITRDFISLPYDVMIVVSKDAVLAEKDIFQKELLTFLQKIK